MTLHADPAGGAAAPDGAAPAPASAVPLSARLRAHAAAARALIASDAPAGRKLDFLTQEFNREANTLCSKADFAALTEAGLELKTVIDRMREQVQNIE